MIQRIQSIYLFLASVFYFSYWFFGLEWYKSGFKILENQFGEYFIINSPILELVLNTTTYVPLLIVIFCTIAIFFYKNRNRQILICKISIYLSLFMSFYTLIYFYYTFGGLVAIMPTKTLEVLLYAAILNPFISTCLIYLALRCIKNDKELVDSLERIR